MTRVVSMFRSVALIAILSAGCDSSEPFEDVAASMEGIYRFESLRENVDACEPGGPSLLTDEAESHLLVEERTVFGAPVLQMISCRSVPDCRAKRDALQRGEPVGADFVVEFEDVAEDGASVRSEGAMSGFLEDGMCRDGGVFTTTASAGEGELLIERRVTLADDHRPDADGICWTDLAAEAAEGRACSELLSGRALFVEAL